MVGKVIVAKNGADISTFWTAAHLAAEAGLAPARPDSADTSSERARQSPVWCPVAPSGPTGNGRSAVHHSCRMHAGSLRAVRFGASQDFSGDGGDFADTKEEEAEEIGDGVAVGPF